MIYKMACHGDNISCMSDYVYDLSINQTSGMSKFAAVEHYCYDIILPIICLVGVFGNILNIIVFTRGRFRHALDEIEKSAATGLVALAVSDLFFCLSALPSPLFSGQICHNGEAWHVLTLYYKTYKEPTLNLFIFTSTWLTIAIAIERYLAVCHPFHSRWLILVSRTITIDIAIYFISLLINIPAFFKYKIEGYPVGNGTLCYYPLVSDLFTAGKFREGYTTTWAIIGVIIPLLILSSCNLRLVVEIHRSQRRSLGEVEPRRHSTSRITVILVAIIMLYLFLTCPSLLLWIHDRLFLHKMNYTPTVHFKIALVVTNVMQALNFSMNFILYCAISRPFRQTVQGKLCKHSSPRNSTETRYELVRTQSKPMSTVPPSQWMKSSA